MRIACFALFFACFSFLAGLGIAQDVPEEEPRPDYGLMMRMNLLLPGTAQKALGQDREATRYYFSLPLMVLGNAMILSGAIWGTDWIVFDAQMDDGNTYLFRYNQNPTPPIQALILGGSIISLYGNFLGVYSSYAAHRDYVDMYGSPPGGGNGRVGRESMVEILTAPYVPKNLLNTDVLPILVLIVFGNMAASDVNRIGDFFRRESVPFLGVEMHPLAGLGLQTVSAALLVTANSAWEEVLYRGLLLETNGPIYSSLSFGLAHLSNMLVPEVGVEQTILQTLFATAFGFYAVDRVTGSGYELKRMVTLHYWNNVLSMILGYILDPDEYGNFSLGFTVAY